MDDLHLVRHLLSDVIRLANKRTLLKSELDDKTDIMHLDYEIFNCLALLRGLKDGNVSYKDVNNRIYDD